MIRFKLLFVPLLMLVLGVTANVQPQIGLVPFDCPNVPRAEFQFDLDRRTITLVLEETDPDTTALFNTLANLHLRNYKAGNFGKILRHYGTNLKARGWSALEKSENFHLYTLTQNETVIGIFVAVKSGGEIYLINMNGQLAPKQVSELVGNLDQLGIEIPDLNAFGARSDAASPSTLLRTPEGDPIHEVRIQTNQGITEPQIKTILEEGPDELIAAITTLRSRLPAVQTLTVRIDTEGAKRIATIIVTAGPDTANPATSPITQPDERISPTTPTTWFRTAEGEPIHEIRIRGNKKITEEEIRAGLEYGPEDISKAIDNLTDFLPYFSRVTLKYANDATKSVAIITVTEKALSSDYYLRPAPLIRFNRVTGWLLAARLELGRRKEMGPLWMWNIPSSVRAYLPKLFGEVGYGFGNRYLNYVVGGDAIRGQPDNWNVGVTAQIHRATTVVAPDLFPRYDSGLYVWYTVSGLTQLHNYYLREGVEVSFRWEPRVPTHSLKLTMRAESHESLQKTTDWHLYNWDSKPEARENPPINPGQLRSVTFRYDLNTRKNSNLGWHNALLIEHSNPAVGSDFDFTRFQLHLRYAVSKGKNIVRTRLMLGFATDVLPIQRKFLIGGPGLLNGYPLYAFAGDHGALLNMEYMYRLSNLYHWEFLKESFIVLSLNEGQVWNTSDRLYRFDLKADVGIGLQFSENVPVFRMNFSKPLESGRGVQVVTTWFYRF